jgi:hypothetical protein
MPPGRLFAGLSFLATACALVSLAIFGRYTMMTYAAGQRGPLFCVREANCAVAETDLLALQPIDAKLS